MLVVVGATGSCSTFDSEATHENLLPGALSLDHSAFGLELD